MSEAIINEVFERVLKIRGISYSPNSRLVEDLGLDSQDLLGMVMELETILDRELDDTTLLMFARSPLGEISARLSLLTR